MRDVGLHIATSRGKQGETAEAVGTNIQCDTVRGTIVARLRKVLGTIVTLGV